MSSLLVYSVTTGDTKMKDEEAAVNWVKLPCDIVSFIALKLIYMEDYIHFGAVCRSWHSVYTENRLLYLHLRRQLPLLMLPTGFYRLVERRVYDFHVLMPMPAHKRSDRSAHCASSSHGWLVITLPGESYQVSLLNPFLPKETEIQLPPLSAFQLEDGHRRRDQPFQPAYLLHAVLSANPTSRPNNYVVLAIFGQYSRLAFCRPSSTCLTSFGSDFFNMEDLFYSKEDQFYAVDHWGSIFTCAFNTTHPLPILSRISPATPRLANLPCTRYLVESGSSRDLLQILRFVDVVEDQDKPNFVDYSTTGFLVFKLDTLRSEWIKMDSLQGCILFLGDNSSMSWRALDFPECKPNTIYFTDDYCPGYCEQEIDGIGPHDMGVFDFEDGTIKPHYPMESNVINPPPVWVELWPNS